VTLLCLYGLRNSSAILAILKSLIDIDIDITDEPGKNGWTDRREV